MILASIWLAGREIMARPGRLLLSALIAAMAVAVVTAVEITALGREALVGEAIDDIAPPLYVVAPGTSAGSIARLEASRPLARDVVAQIRAAAGPAIRLIRARRLTPSTLNGVACVSVEAATDAQGPQRGAGGIEIGAELARQARVGRGGYAARDGKTERIASIRPATGTADDLAVFLDSGRGSDGGPSVVAIFLNPGEPAAAVAESIRERVSDVDVLEIDRGQLADGGIDQGLRSHRLLVTGLLGLLVALTLAMASHLDADERRLELATMTAVGLSGAAMLAHVIARAATAAVAGSLVGLVGSTALLLVSTDVPASVAWRLPGFAGAVLAGVLLISAAASLPAAVKVALRSPVPALQEAG